MKAEEVITSLIDGSDADDKDIPYGICRIQSGDRKGSRSAPLVERTRQVWSSRLAMTSVTDWSSIFPV